MLAAGRVFLTDLLFPVLVCLSFATCGSATEQKLPDKHLVDIETVSWVEMANADKFSCSIRMDKDTYSPGDPVQLSFQLTNNNDVDMHVLTWHTPLEGMRNDYLDVTVGGEKVPYRGIMVKRGPPSADSYVLIPAGETVSASVNIREGYSTDTCGKYSVRLKTSLMDVVPKKEGVDFVPNGFDGFTSVGISCDPVEFDIVA